MEPFIFFLIYYLIGIAIMLMMQVEAIFHYTMAYPPESIFHKTSKISNLSLGENLVGAIPAPIAFLIVLLLYVIIQGSNLAKSLTNLALKYIYWIVGVFFLFIEVFMSIESWISDDYLFLFLFHIGMVIWWVVLIQTDLMKELVKGC